VGAGKPAVTTITAEAAAAALHRISIGSLQV
jgi:hypothetical protein